MLRSIPFAAHSLLTGVIAGLFVVPVHGADLHLKVEIPRLNVAEYHRPYVAIWLENADQELVGNLAVWYDVGQRNNEGAKWLKDMRAWWRKSGRELQMPVDGLSGATRPPGEHTLNVAGGKAPLIRLPAGEYAVVVEAAREVGGREVVRVPFRWSGQEAKSTQGVQTQQAHGQHELGTVTLAIKP